MPARRRARATVLGMTEKSSRRAHASTTLLMIAAIASVVGLTCTALAGASEGGAFPPEAVLLPAMLATLFALLWWLVAAVLVTGLLCGIRTPPRRARMVPGAIAVVAFAGVIALQWQLGLFPWPFTPRFG